MPLNRKSYLQIVELPAQERSTDRQARWRKLWAVVIAAAALEWSRRCWRRFSGSAYSRRHPAQPDIENLKNGGLPGM
jgi:hypothetical protein